MKLQSLAAEPKLINILIEDEETVTRYGESIDFWMWDRQDLDVFLRLSTVDSDSYSSIAEVVSKLVLNEDGNPVLTGNNLLPVDVMLKVIDITITRLGNLQAQTSEK